MSHMLHARHRKPPFPRRRYPRTFSGEEGGAACLARRPLIPHNPCKQPYSWSYSVLTHIPHTAVPAQILFDKTFSSRTSRRPFNVLPSETRPFSRAEPHASSLLTACPFMHQQSNARLHARRSSLPNKQNMIREKSFRDVDAAAGLKKKLAHASPPPEGVRLSHPVLGYGTQKLCERSSQTISDYYCKLTEH